MTETPAEYLTSTISEADFQRTVIDMAHALGWLVHHTRPARTAHGMWRTPIEGDAGFFDLVLARRGRLILAELKREGGKLTAPQEAWFDAASPPEHEASNHEVYLWRPSDMAEIEGALR